MKVLTHRGVLIEDRGQTWPSRVPMARARARCGHCRRQPSLALDRAEYGTHSMRGTHATLIYRRTRHWRVVQWLLGHSKLASTARHLGIEVDDALEISGRSSAAEAGV